MKTKNKIVLVTGGSRGLGKDMALSLAKKGVIPAIVSAIKKNFAKQFLYCTFNLDFKT